MLINKIKGKNGGDTKPLEDKIERVVSQLEEKIVLDNCYKCLILLKYYHQLFILDWILLILNLLHH